jgi:hypothetical protein
MDGDTPHQLRHGPSRLIDNQSMVEDRTQARTGAALAEVACPLPHDQVEEAESEDLVVLPLREDENGNGIYPENTVTLVKRLRANGVDAHYLHPPERRRFEGRNGFVEIAVVSVILGVLSSAAWDGLKRLFSKRPDARLKITFGRKVGLDGSSTSWCEVEGDATDVIAAIDRLIKGDSQQVDSGEPSSTVMTTEEQEIVE